MFFEMFQVHRPTHLDSKLGHYVSKDSERGRFVGLGRFPILKWH